MGREIRRVPPDWQHPTQPCKHSPWARGCDYAKTHAGQCFVPLYDESLREAVAKWKAGYAAWEAGTHPDKKPGKTCEYWEWHGDPPSEGAYREREWTEAEATAYQMYETVSEGTPVSPVFPTLEALTDWLVSQGHSRHAAEQFAKSGWAPSMVMSEGKLASNVDVYDIVPGPK